MERVERFTALEAFPIDAFPDWARKYVDAQAHVLQVDRAVVALAVLGAVAISVQGKAGARGARAVG